MTEQFQEIPGGFRLWLCRVGKVLENAEGKQVYFQPGDDEAALLDEIPADKRPIIADMALGEYFA